jgi:diguanylate cyclase (GGDEF)-like protein/PAS domain S-box-containing protein
MFSFMRLLRSARARVGGILALGTALSCLGLLSRPGDALAIRVAVLGYACAAALASVACAARVRRDGSDTAPAWTLLLLALVTEAAARTLGAWTAGSSGGRPGALDVLHVAALGLVAAGLTALPGTAAACRGWRVAVNGAGVGLATTFLAGGPLFAGVHALGVAAYVAGAHLLGCVVAAVAAFAMLSLLPAAALAAVAGDAAAASGRLAGSYAIGGLADAGWLAAAALVAAAAGAGPTRSGGAPAAWQERVGVLAVVLPSGAAFAVAVGDAVTGREFGALTAWSLLGLAACVLLRLGAALVDNLVASRTLEERVAERTLELVTTEQWFRSLVQHSSDVLTVVDATGIVRYQSPAVTRVFGHDPAALIGTPLTYLVRPADAARLESLLAEAAREPRTTYVVEFAVWHKDGRWCETETTVTSLVDDADIRGLVLNTRDISERKRLEDALTHQAFHDHLTGLANRVLFRDRVAQALAHTGYASRVGVLFLDLDGFKGVNDTQGHAVGDQLLGLVAERLAHCVRPGDTVARLGGDEFAVLVHGADCGKAVVWVADRVRHAISQPFVLDGREISIRVSTGIAVNDVPYQSADALLRNADVAMYRAKARGDGSWVRFESGMRDVLLERAELANDLRSALARGQLAVYYQPTVELAGGHIVGAEALVRWHHPNRGLLGPDGFVALAEEIGLIAEVGEWVLREACREAAGWQAWSGHGEHFHVAVNLSAKQIGPDLVRSVRSALDESRLPPGALVLEITESVLVERTDDLLDVLHGLKALGVRLAIDDFGTGSSSLSYLSRFPVDALKMDRSFVEAITNPGEHGELGELARTIIQLGSSLGLATVAEGIETQAQHEALRAMGCDYGQGYLFARVLPPAALDELLGCRTAGPVVPAAHGDDRAVAASRGAHGGGALVP